MSKEDFAEIRRLIGRIEKMLQEMSQEIQDGTQDGVESYLEERLYALSVDLLGSSEGQLQDLSHAVQMLDEQLVGIWRDLNDKLDNLQNMVEKLLNRLDS
jgi:hypothetical protein